MESFQYTESTSDMHAEIEKHDSQDHKNLMLRSARNEGSFLCPKPEQEPRERADTHKNFHDYAIIRVEPIISVRLVNSHAV